MRDHAHDHGMPAAASGTTAIDPVCGMTVVVGEAAGGSMSHDGTTYHFCSSHCRSRFEAGPDAVLAAIKKT